FGVMHRVSLRVALEPLGVRLYRVFPVEVGAHARDDMHAALLGRGATLAEEIARPEELALAMKGHLGLIERQNSRDAYHHCVDLQAGPVAGPLLAVEARRIVLGHVGLAEAPDRPLPGDFRLREELRGSGCRRWKDDKFATVQIHKQLRTVISATRPRSRPVAECCRDSRYRRECRSSTCNIRGS